MLYKHKTKMTDMTDNKLHTEKSSEELHIICTKDMQDAFSLKKQAGVLFNIRKHISSGADSHYSLPMLGYSAPGASKNRNEFLL